MAEITLEQVQKENEKHVDSLQRAIKILERRLIQVEAHNRSLDALARRATAESQRAQGIAIKATNEIAQIHNMLSRRG